MGYSWNLWDYKHVDLTLCYNGCQLIFVAWRHLSGMGWRWLAISFSSNDRSESLGLLTKHHIHMISWRPWRLRLSLLCILGAETRICEDEISGAVDSADASLLQMNLKLNSLPSCRILASNLAQLETLASETPTDQHRNSVRNDPNWLVFPADF